MRVPLRSPPSSPARGRAATLVALLFLAAVAVALAVWVRLRSDAGGRGGEAALTQDQDQLARELAAAWFSKTGDRGHLQKALEALGPLLEREEPAAEDLVRAGILEQELAIATGAAQHAQRARELFARAQALAPDDAALHYVLGQMERYDGHFERALPHLRKAHAGAPDDIPTILALASVLEESEPGESERLYRQVIDLGIDFTGSWYPVALYRLASLLAADPARSEEFERLSQEHRRLTDRGIQAPNDDELRRGNLGRLQPTPPPGSRQVQPLPLPAFGAGELLAGSPGGLDGLRASDLDGDGRTDLVGWGSEGLWVALRLDGGGWEQRELLAGRKVSALALLDLTNDPDPKRNPRSHLDLLAAAGGELLLLRANSGAEAVQWRVLDAPIATLPAPASGLLAVDYDHEGDLDLLAVGAFGSRLLRNDGASTLGSDAPKGGFTDATAEAGLSATRAAVWCASEDLDSDQDVDLLLGDHGGVQLASNLRGGRFEDQSQRVSAVAPARRPPVLADCDGDARVDLWTPEGGTFLNRLSARLEPAGSRELAPVAGDAGAPVAAPGEQEVAAFDLDGDSAADACWLRVESGALGLEGQLALGLREQRGFRLPLDGSAEAGPLALADFDGNASPDLARAASDGVRVHPGAPRGCGTLALTLRGLKDNRRGIGAIVEVRAGASYQRIYCRGETLLAGVGAASRVDWLRVLWPNGGFQWELEPALGPRPVEQTATLYGSCPFLYTWNGSEFEFVTDVLGITPLGLPMAPGMLVPPDHDEYVLIRGEQLAPLDGRLELQITEELREVTYLDRARLDLVDHPADTEIFPNELFCFPPFPPAHTHSVKAPLPPARALGSDGRDWSAALASIDGEFAAPFEPAPWQYLGLATPHWIELEFPREAVASAPLLRLVMTGWFFWTDASVNMAAARSGEHAFLPPLFQVPDGEGGWKDAGPPVGFPAGKTKSMVIDVTGLLRRDDPRLRIASTLRLYWDAIRLATDGGDAPLATISLEPSSALLWRRGFSAPLETGQANQPERFVWERLAEFPRWNPHPGSYTRYGETLPLVQAIDDQFVILGSGDALTLSFDASALPPLAPGLRRDYLLFLDGWAKDRDPNTLEAEHVEPLPFHGMSGYPYGPSERFPDDAAHRAWRKEWNTRLAEPWMPLALPPRAPDSSVAR